MAEDQQTTFGPNDWLVDEMYEQYRRDPSSVAESWQDFFADYEPREQSNGQATPAGAATAAEPVAAPPAAAEPAASKPVAARAAPDAETARPIRGAQARIVANMEASLTVPTATS